MLSSQGMMNRIALAFVLGLAATTSAAPQGKVELRLELAKPQREFAPDQAIPLRLSNGSSRPLYLIVERRGNLRTERGARFPGVPVHERRKRKFFFRSDRWVYTSSEQARFTGALLEPGDAVRFDTRFSLPASYRIYVRYWWMANEEEEKEFLKLTMQALEDKYGERARWLNTPTFRIKAPPAKPAPK